MLLYFIKLSFKLSLTLSHVGETKLKTKPFPSCIVSPQRQKRKRTIFISE
jgi:hypothetical protein